MELAAKLNVTHVNTSAPKKDEVNVQSAQKLILDFRNTDLKTYIQCFEKIAITNQIAKDKQAILLINKLADKVSNAMNTISISEMNDYDVLKEYVLFIN